jgi:hypothetical protein
LGGKKNGTAVVGLKKPVTVFRKAERRGSIQQDNGAQGRKSLWGWRLSHQVQPGQADDGTIAEGKDVANKPGGRGGDGRKLPGF